LAEKKSAKKSGKKGSKKCRKKCGKKSFFLNLSCCCLETGLVKACCSAREAFSFSFKWKMQIWNNEIALDKRTRAF
jgi:hypothetical protein